MAAAKEFNVGKDTLVDFLLARGFSKDDLKPTSKLSEEMYRSLQQEFQGDKVAKLKSDQIDLPKGAVEARKRKEDEAITFRKEKSKPAEEPKEIKPAEPKEEVPPPAAPTPAPAPAPVAPAPMAPVPAPIPALKPKPLAPVEIVPESPKSSVPMPNLDESDLPALHVMPKRPEDIQSSKRGPVVKMSSEE